MKKIVFLLLITVAGLGLSVFQSCNKVKDIIKINVPVNMEYDFEIPPIPDTTQSVSTVVDIDYDIDAAIKGVNSKLGVENIKSANISSVNLSILPENQDAEDNLTALSALSLALSSDVKQDFVTLCSLTQPPAEPYFADLPVNETADLSAYFTSNKFHFKVGAKAHKFTSRVIKCKAKIKFIITASL